MKRLLRGLAFAIGIVGLAHPLGAKVIKFEILRSESPAFEGRTFGAVGTTIGSSPAPPWRYRQATRITP
jgi:hypothetical protein